MIVIRARRRLCADCGESKPLTAKHWHRSGRGYALRCKPCMIYRVNTNRRLHVAKIRAIKSTTPCADCGRQYPFYVMQFDHRPGEVKLGALSKMQHSSYSWQTLQQEINKCDVVCANCHAERTWMREHDVE